MSSLKGYRPLVTSQAFNNNNVFFPFRYNFSIEEIAEIKKFLPKNLFKLQGIDAQDQNLHNQDEQALQRFKIKIKAVKGVSTETKKPLQFLSKQQVKIIEWYNKSIDLRIPYSSKLSQAMLQQHLSLHVSYYIQNFMLFKDTLNQQIYTSLSENAVKLNTDKIATETDIVFTCWNIDPEPSDDLVKTIKIDVPVILCLNLNQTYDLARLKQIIQADIMASISILLKHNFNTRVITVGMGQKQFVCLNSYCQQQNALEEEQKLKTIIGQQNKTLVQTQKQKMAAKKDHTFLYAILGLLIFIYFALKLFPDSGEELEPLYQKSNEI